MPNKYGFDELGTVRQCTDCFLRKHTWEMSEKQQASHSRGHVTERKRREEEAKAEREKILSGEFII